MDAELGTIERRQRRTDWTAARLEAQRRRLAHARRHCDLYLRTDELASEQVAAVVDAFLREHGITPAEGQPAPDRGAVGLANAGP